MTHQPSAISYDDLKKHSEITKRLMRRLVERPASLTAPPNGTTDNPVEMLDVMQRHVKQREPRVIPVDKLTEGHVEIPGPLFHTFKHHATFAGHDQFKVDGKPMTIINLKGEGMYTTKDEIMDHLSRAGRYETMTCAAYFVIGAIDVNDAIASVQKYARKNSTTFFNCTPSASRYTPYGGKKHSRTHNRKGKGKRKGKSLKRKFSKK